MKPLPHERVWSAPEDRDVRLDAIHHGLAHFVENARSLTDGAIAVEIEGGEWRARWLIAEQAGGYVVRSVTLEPVSATTPPGGVTTNLLRELSPQNAIAALVQTVPTVLDVLSTSIRREAVGRMPAPGPTTASPRGGPPRVSDEELANVAMAYLQELAQGRSGITTRLRKSLGFEKDSTVRDRIRMCRERGWLSATQQGRRGGHAGERLIQWQQQREDQES